MLYYQPEDSGLEPIAEYDLYEESYEFTIVAVWRETATGKLWVGSDSGCSCPVPFEDHTFPTDYNEVRSVADVLEEIKGIDSEYRGRVQPYQEFLRQVQEALDAR